jgi:hypothetical protein
MIITWLDKKIETIVLERFDVSSIETNVLEYIWF